MKYKNGMYAKTICEEDAELFDRELNKVLADCSNTQVQWHNIVGKFACTVIGKKFVEIPETIADEYEVRGEIHYCCECKYFEKPTDKRMKYIRCPHSSCSVGANTPCCEFFYEMLEAGEKILKEGRDD